LYIYICFFQAEDGIRDRNVTGVQTCALPIFEKSLKDIIPENQNAAFDMMELINRVIDEDSFCEIKKLFATELITGLARIDGKVVGIIANQPRAKGGVLFTDSADKAAKFIQLCDAFNIPLLFLKIGRAHV